MFLTALGKAAKRPASVYLVGGATAVIEGWRESTVDIDLRLDPDYDELYRAIASLKDELGVNVEIASPDLFIPVPAGWEDRSPYVATEGALTIRHFDLTAQCLAKISRGHERDRTDVMAMIERGLVTREGIAGMCERMKDELHRFPGINAPKFVLAVSEWTKEPGEGR